MKYYSRQYLRWPIIEANIRHFFNPSQKAQARNNILKAGAAARHFVIFFGAKLTKWAAAKSSSSIKNKYGIK